MIALGPARAHGQDGDASGADDEAPDSEAEPAVDPIEQARVEYATGVTHAQAGEWAEAEAAFLRALELHPASAIYVNLASAQVEQGRFREAHAALLEAEANPELAESLRGPISQLRSRIRREGGRLAISRSGDSVGADVILDDAPVAESWLAGDIPVAPGAHLVLAQREGVELTRADVQVGVGERTQVVLGLSERVIEGTTEPDDTPLFIGIGVGAGAAAVVAIIIIAVVVASSGNSQPVGGNFDPGLIVAVKTALPIVGLLAALLAACNSSPTQIVIQVDSDLQVPSDLDHVTIRMVSPAGREQTAEALLGPGQLPLPRFLGVVHEGGPLDGYATTVTGFRASTEVVSRQGTLTFQEGRIRLWMVNLDADCVGVGCGADETCAGGMCRPVQVPAEDLLPWDDRTFPEDAGVTCLEMELCNERDDDCDDAIDEGIDTQTDDANCGRCGVDCADLPNAAASCVSGACEISACDTGFDDCGPDPGCETDIRNDPNNCSTCGMVCRNPDNQCCNGMCQRTCP